jgi:hypothetical protein
MNYVAFSNMTLLYASDTQPPKSVHSSHSKHLEPSVSTVLMVAILVTTFSGLFFDQAISVSYVPFGSSHTHLLPTGI